MPRPVAPRQTRGKAFTTPPTIMKACAVAFGSEFHEEVREEVTLLIQFILQEEYQPDLLFKLPITKRLLIFNEAIDATKGWMLDAYQLDTPQRTEIRRRIKMVTLFVYSAATIEPTLDSFYHVPARTRLFEGVEYVFIGGEVRLIQLTKLSRGQVRLAGQIGRVGKNMAESLKLQPEQLTRLQVLEDLAQLARE